MSEQDFEVVQEKDKVASRKIVAIAIGSVIIGAAGVVIEALLLMAGAGSVKIDTVPPGQAQRPATVHIGEVKQTDIYRKAWGQELLAAQRKELESYRWVEKDRGVAQIPIDKAMDIVVEKSR